MAAAAGAVGVALVGCESNDDGASAIPAADAAALRQVAGEALDLANRYDAAISQNPDQAAKLTPIRDAHREHAAAIGRSLDASVSAAAPTSSGSTGSGGAGSGGALKALATAEKAAAERAVAACVAVASHYAPLLGAVAAARASHAEVLQ
ncbi:hypothetical protein [Virgisporangium aurantiacum]|uniref:Lipoprotein n=1 Tax=Virgisporangium aurantiacum TaxID=175570 RepID=A0A8J3YYF0_9ACTN|nr:hypothetical protein [Virgisporangium aurantiacum]GIJ52952.1 hypothetical protein Vau01_004680 [Virgisporangium aurantiacum]